MRNLQVFAGILFSVATLAGSASAQAPESAMLGHWQDPSGGILEVYRCDTALCIRLEAFSEAPPKPNDSLNPDPAQRSRPLCGMVIGQGFHLEDPSHAEGGTLYDPKSGKTYKGSLMLDGASLKLRGYIGIKAFGRSAVWARAAPGFKPCKVSS